MVISRLTYNLFIFATIVGLKRILLNEICDFSWWRLNNLQENLRFNLLGEFFIRKRKKKISFPARGFSIARDFVRSTSIFAVACFLGLIFVLFSTCLNICKVRWDFCVSSVNPLIFLKLVNFLI